jgi:hypothetical protein
MRIKIEITEILKLYHITEDGMIYSKIRKRWLKPQLNNCEYVFYYLKPYNKWLFAHTLVALAYIGPPPTDKHEVNHKDTNRMNNHYLNLEWVTHSANILKAYEQGREHFWLGKHRASPELQTRLLMSNAKKKRVQYKSESQLVIYESIEDAASQLQTYRKRIYLCIKDNRPIKGGCLSFVPDLMEG